MDAVQRANMIGQCKTTFNPDQERRTLQCAGIFTGYYANNPNMIAQICCERKVNAEISRLNVQKNVAETPPTESEEKIDKLAKNKDPELIKKEAEAKVMTLTADKQKEVLAQKDNVEKEVAEKLTSLTETFALALAVYLAFPPKLPVINVKALAKKAYAKTKKELRELRQKVSKENLKKGKESFKYPMKPKQLVVPKVPEIPKLPTVPSVPTIPSVPAIPSVPSVPRIPRIP